MLGLGVSIKGVLITSLGCRLSRRQEGILVRAQRPGYAIILSRCILSCQSR